MSLPIGPIFMERSALRPAGPLCDFAVLIISIFLHRLGFSRLAITMNGGIVVFEILAAEVFHEVAFDADSDGCRYAL